LFPTCQTILKIANFFLFSKLKELRPHRASEGAAIDLERRREVEKSLDVGIDAAQN